MDQLRAITDNINVFVRFFESINCLMYQLQWLKHQMMHAPNDVLILAMAVLVIVAITMLSCANFTCDGNTIAIPIFSVIFCIFGWFLYKRYRVRAESNAASVHAPGESEKFIAPTAAATAVPSAEVYFHDREAGVSMVPIAKRL